MPQKKRAIRQLRQLLAWRRVSQQELARCAFLATAVLSSDLRYGEGIGQARCKQSERDVIIRKPMEIDKIEKAYWSDEDTYGHGESQHTFGASWAEKTKEKAQGKELVPRGECSATWRQSAPTKARDTKAKEKGGNEDGTQD